MKNLTENAFKNTRLKKESWKYLKNKLSNKETSTIEELDTLIQKEKF